MFKNFRRIFKIKEIHMMKRRIMSFKKIILKLKNTKNEMRKHSLDLSMN